MNGDDLNEGFRPGYGDHLGNGDPAAVLSAEATAILDSMVRFDGHNGFIGAGGKQDAIRKLRVIAGQPGRPSPADLEAYLAAQKRTSVDMKGAARARKWYEEILTGTRHRDQGRPI